MTDHVDRPNKTGWDQLEVQRRKAERFMLEHETIRDCVEAVIDDEPRGKRERLFALFCAGLYFIKGGREQALLAIRREKDFSVPPLDPDDYSISHQELGSGYWNDVYLAEPTEEGKQKGLTRVVVKIEYPAVQQPQQELDELLLGLKAEYKFLKEQYTAVGLPDLISDTPQYLFATNPTTKKLAIAQIQVFAGDDPVDLMSLKDERIVRRLLRENDSLRNEFRIFRETTLRLREEGMKEPDLAGFGNVLIVNVDGRYTLRLVDPHRIPPNKEMAQKSQASALEHLRSL